MPALAAQACHPAPCAHLPSPSCVLLQAVLQLPCVLCLLWFSASLKAGNILFLAKASWASILSSPTSIYFFIYAGAPHSRNHGMRGSQATRPLLTVPRSAAPGGCPRAAH